MVKCPNCKKEIGELTHIRSGSVSQKCYLLDEEMDYGTYEFFDDDNVSEYNCPLCDETLFTNEEQAIKFLKNEK